MNCQTCQSELEDLLHGEVDTAWKIALHEHLSVCADCRAAQVALERENELFAQYYEQNSIEPSEEMWQAIRARIQPESATTKTSTSGWAERLRNWFAPILVPAMLRQAGFAALLILVSVGLTALYFTSRNATKDDVATQTSSPLPTALPQPSPTQQALPEPTLPQQAPAPNLPTPNFRESVKPQVASLKPPAPKTEIKEAQPKLTEDQLLAQQIAKASREYQSAINLLERTIAKRKTQLDEGTVKQFEGSLAMIDASIASSRAALRAHPNDPAAARFLLAAYSKKVELMQEIAMR